MQYINYIEINIIIPLAIIAIKTAERKAINRLIISEFRVDVKF